MLATPWHLKSTNLQGVSARSCTGQSCMHYSITVSCICMEGLAMCRVRMLSSQQLTTTHVQEVLEVCWSVQNACISPVDYHPLAGSAGHVLVRT